MSLRGVHILFIACASACCAFFGAWAWHFYAYAGGAGKLFTAAIAFAVAAGLLFYLAVFVRKAPS